MSIKKVAVITVVALVVAGGGGFAYVKLAGGQPDAAKLATTQVKRGKIRITITATGKVVSNRDVDIKCKASGAVIRMPKHPRPQDNAGSDVAAATGRVATTQLVSDPAGELDVSDPVKAGKLMAELDPLDMVRIRDKARVQVDCTQAKLDLAQKNLELARLTWATDKLRADWGVVAGEVHQRDAHNKARRELDLRNQNVVSEDECETFQTAATQADVDLENAKIHVREVGAEEVTIALREQDVKAAEATLKSDKVSLDSAQDQVNYCKIVCPIDGVVSAKDVQIGSTISSSISNVGGGTTVFTVSDLSRIYVLASVDESDIGQLLQSAGATLPTSRPADGHEGQGGTKIPGLYGGKAIRADGASGSAPPTVTLPPSRAELSTSQPDYPQKVTITADAYKGVKFRGKITRIATAGVNQSNVVTFEVQIEVTSPNKALLRPMMTANVEITTVEADDVLIAPADAVVVRDGKRIVTVVGADGKQQDREVEVGLSNGFDTEVTKGVSEGETVVVRKGSDSKWNGGPQQRGGPPNMFGGSGGSSSSGRRM